MPLILGLDNGLSGALAFFDTVSGDVQVLDMPTKEIIVSGKPRQDFDVDAFLYIITEVDLRQAFLEQGQGVKGQSPARSYNYGFRAGGIHGALRARAVPTIVVPPQKWKRAFGLIGKDKDASREQAQFFWPEHAKLFKRKMDHGRAEAALIALWGFQNV